jgi:hypothetical protein
MSERFNVRMMGEFAKLLRAKLLGLAIILPFMILTAVFREKNVRMI